jgi:hypothetical protein
MNIATALEAAELLLLALGVTPDIQPAGRTEGARRMRELMAAADRQVCTYTYEPVRYVSNACRRGGRGAMATKPGLPAME